MIEIQTNEGGRPFFLNDLHVLQNQPIQLWRQLMHSMVLKNGLNVTGYYSIGGNCVPTKYPGYFQITPGAVFNLYLNDIYYSIPYQSGIDFSINAPDEEASFADYIEINFKRADSDEIAVFKDETQHALYTNYTVTFGARRKGTPPDYALVYNNGNPYFKGITKFEDILDGSLIGEIKMWTGAEIPDKYMPCDGRTLEKSQYSRLAMALGLGEDGQTTFQIPDLRGRFVLGHNNDAESPYNEVGATGGSEAVKLEPNQIPNVQHKHSLSEYAKHQHEYYTTVETSEQGLLPTNHETIYDINAYTGGSSENNDLTHCKTKTEPAADDSIVVNSAMTGNVIGGNASVETHDNMPPYYVLQYIIKVK